MIMTTLKMCSLHKESFYGGILLTSWMFLWEKYPNRWAGSVSGIIYFSVYVKSVPSCQTRHAHNHVMKITLTSC